MKLLSGILLCAVTAAAADFPTLERLFSRPYLWGTSPDQITWSKQGHTLAFLWNAQGGRFHDLYSYDPEQRKLVRLTDLEKEKDELNISEDEKDERLRQYLMPPAGLAAFDLSRDGKRVAFSYKGDLYIVNTDGATPALRLTRTKTVEAQPAFGPDGTKLASIRGGQVVIQDLATGQIWQATDVEGGALAGYRWSPDGQSFVYAVRRGAGRTLPLTNYSGRLVATRTISRSVAGDESGESALYLTSAIGGKATPVDLGQGNTRGNAILPEWSPDSRKLVLTLATANWKKKQIIVIDAKTAKTKSVAEESDPRWVDYGQVEWSPDSRYVLFTNEKDGYAHLYKVPADGGDVQQLTKGAWEIHKEPFTHPAQWIGDAIYYTSTEGGPSERHTFRIKADGTEKQKLSTQAGLNSGLVSEDGKYIAWSRADLDNPLDLWVDDQRVTTSPQPGFKEVAWPKSKFVEFPARGDKAIVHAKILLPPGYNPDDRSQKPRPAVFFIHGAGYATSVLKQWGSYHDVRYAYNTYLANKGYVVLDMDYRGSTGYGRDWRAGVYLHMGGPDFDDVLGGIDYLKSLGNVDMNRVGIWGVSYGGFMTDMAMFLSPGTFKAGAAWAAVNDWENYNAGYTAQRLNTPQSNPEAYRRSSPIHFSGNLKDHLLIVHGMVDDNVLFQDAVQLTEKLIHEGKDFSHIYYPEESHGFVRDETWIDAFRRTTEWFDRYLQ